MKCFYASCIAMLEVLDVMNVPIAVIANFKQPGNVVLAASPPMKERFHIKTGNRLFEIPKYPDIRLFEPKMSFFLNKDRGTIKWTSLMLPEHVERLQAWENELQDTPPKEKADWELEALHETIQRAYEHKMPITFTLYQQNTWQTTTGFITTIDALKKHLLLETNTTVKAISFQAIQEVEVDD